MTITYENTKDDALAWSVYRMFETPQAKKRMPQERRQATVLNAGMSLPLIFGLCVAALLTEGDSISPIGLCLMLTILLAGIAATVHAYHRYPKIRKRQAEEMGRMMIRDGYLTRFLGPQTLSLASDGVHCGWVDGETRMNWSALKRWDATETHIVLIWNDSPNCEWMETDFTLIPKRAFHDADRLRQFLEELEQYREAAVNGALLPASEPILAVKPTVTETSATTDSGANWWRDRQNMDGDPNTLRRQ
jgi:hypothetical protein